MGYRIVRKPSKAYIVRSGANYYAENDVNLENSLGATEQDYYAVLENSVFGKILIDSVNYLVATADLEMISDASDYNQIQNTDDVIPLRYAYGNQNGYIPGIGSELDGNYENGIFTLGSGRVVIQGVEIDIDNNGLPATLDTASETRYYKIYLKANFNRNLNLYDAMLVSYYSTISYDEIPDPTSGELINNETAYLLLYALKLNATTQVELVKKIKQIYFGNSRVLWSGNVAINTTDIVTIGQVNIANKLVEIEIEDQYGRTRYIKFKQKTDNMSFDYSDYYLDFVAGNAITFVCVRFIQYTALELRARITEIRFTLTSGAGPDIAFPCTVRSIREIIE